MSLLKLKEAIRGVSRNGWINVQALATETDTTEGDVTAVLAQISGIKYDIGEHGMHFLIDESVRVPTALASTSRMRPQVVRRPYPLYSIGSKK